MKTYTTSRTKEIAIYQSVGATRNQVLAMFTVEFSIISLFITLIGTFVFLLSLYVLNSTLFKDWFVVSFEWNNLILLGLGTIASILILGYRPVNRIATQITISQLKSYQ